jgi:hypothetical protein
VLAGAKHPAIAADAVGNLYVAWIQAGICLTMSTDGGGTWTSPENINSLGANTNFAPAIAAAGSGSAFVVWSNEVDPGNNELFCQTTTNGGATWASARQVTWTAGDSMMPELRYAYGNLFLLWDDDTPGKEEIYFRKSTNGASTWSAAKRLTWNTGVSYSAKTAIPSSGNVHVVWMDNTPGHYEIYHRIGTANGTGWDTARRITWNYCADQAVAVDPNDKLHLVYRVFSAGPGNGELYYKAYQE